MSTEPVLKDWMFRFPTYPGEENYPAPTITREEFLELRRITKGLEEYVDD